MNLIEIFSIIIIHWIADFILQTEKQGMNKSKDFDILLSHTINYSIVWILFGIFYTLITDTVKLIPLIILFSILTFFIHTITDYYTSKITSKRYLKNHFYGFNGFWFWIGLDQILHYIQLFTMYHFFKILT